jgi:hypothetical protein
LNFREWIHSDNYREKHFYKRKVRKIQKSLQYNNNQDAIVIHHLRDTEEQRKYNDEHYELWGFEIDEDGNEHFEYGKYVIFVTKEEHTEIHRCSDETKNKIRVAMTGENNPMYGKHHSAKTKKVLRIKNTGKRHTKESLEKMRLSHLGHKVSDETKNKIRVAMTGENNHRYGISLSDSEKLNLSIKNSGENNPMYGGHLSEEHKLKISNANKGRKPSENTVLAVKKAQTDKIYSEETKKKLSESVSKTWNIIKQQYAEYKETGGELKWKDFLKIKDTLF